MPQELRDETLIIYSAHGIPLSFVKAGDPYPDQIAETITGIQSQLSSQNAHRLAFQSRAGPIKWTGPDLEHTVKMLGQEGCRSVLLVPISFVSDHMETLFELDIEVKEIADSVGIESYVRCPSFNADPDFLGLLAGLVQDSVGAELP